MTLPIYTRATKLYWYAFLLAAGAASTAVEMTGLRFLAPLFGSSLPVWGAAIATVIAGLAWGYARGGRQAERMVSPLLPIQTAALGAAVFLWTPAAYRLAAWLRDLSLNQNISAALVGAFGVSFLALLIPSIVFGSFTPLAVQVEAARRRIPAGAAAGRIFTITTIGSMIGIIVPSFLTIPMLGTKATVWLFSGILLLLAGGRLLIPRRAAGALLAAMGLLTSFIPPTDDPAVLLAVETPYQHVTVRQQSGKRSLAFDAHLGTQSVMTNSVYTDGYWDYLAALPAFLPADEPKVLVLGAAASTTERQLQRFWSGRKSFHFTSVELDGALVPIAQAYFDPPERQSIIADARAFTAADKNRYDFIVLDTYARELSVPFHLTTIEFFTGLKDRLDSGGILAVNANSLSRDSLWIKSLARTLTAVFPDVRVATVPHSCNHLLLAAATPLPHSAPSVPAIVSPLLPTLLAAALPSPGGILLTDDRAPADALGLLALITSPDNSSCN